MTQSFKTKEDCFAAVQEHGWAIEFVPSEFRTSELWLVVMPQAIWGVQYQKACLDLWDEDDWDEEIGGFSLSEAGRSLDFCLADGIDVFEYVPEELKTPDFYLAAVQYDGMALEYMPEKLKTLELCLIAVRNDEEALEFVPKKLRKKML